MSFRWEGRIDRAENMSASAEMKAVVVSLLSHYSREEWVLIHRSATTCGLGRYFAEMAMLVLVFPSFLLQQVSQNSAPRPGMTEKWRTFDEKVFCSHSLGLDNK